MPGTIREEQLDRLEAAGYTPSFFTAHVYYWGDRHRDLFMAGNAPPGWTPCAPRWIAAS